MFKTNGTSDRVDYGTMLLPPLGYTLERAIGTTYSLDLEALTAVCINLGLSEEDHDTMLQNPIVTLNALQKVSEKVLIFCEAGQIKKPGNPGTLNILLEKMVVPVALPRDKKLNHYPAFHPKTWILQYKDSKGNFKYRFVVLSRNLTFDRSWDVAFCMDSEKKSSAVSKTEPLISFVKYLKKQIKNDQTDYSRKRNLAKRMISALQGVAFTTDSKEFGENFQILPLGIGDGYDMDGDPLMNEERNAADYSFHELVVFSPFITASVMDSWNDEDRTLTGTVRSLITRKSELGKLKASQVSDFNVYALKDDIVTGENQLSGGESGEKKQQDIHAKIYLRRKYSTVDLYLGSMNATYSGIHKNVEMMIKLTTKNRYYNGQEFLKDIFGGKYDNPSNPFEEVIVKNQDAKEDASEQENNRLECIVKDICRTPKRAEIMENGDSFNVHVTIDGDMTWNNVTINPFRRNVFVPIANDMTFEHMDVLQLSEFYEITVTGETQEIHRIIMIPTIGIPENREKAIVNNVVKDKKSFVEYVAFVLGEDYLLTMMEEHNIQESGFSSKTETRMPALYEKMLRAAYEEPGRLTEIEYLLKMITDQNIVPGEFRKLYETFKKTLQL